MVRFSEIIKNGQEFDLGKKVNKAAEESLKKIGILNKDEEESEISVDEVRGCYQKLLILAFNVQSWVQNKEPIDSSLIIPVLRSIIDNGLIDSLYYHLVFEGDKGDKLATHAIDVTLFSLKVGIGMGYDNKRLLALAMVAFLQDVGMYEIPHDILKKKGRLSEQEFRAVQRHPEIGADILSGLSDKHRWLTDMALQVHERADGSGYPKGLKENQIHEYAYIIGLVDMYSAMIKDRPYRNRIEQNRAMRDIISYGRGRFPAKIVKVFLNQVSFFPVNSFVKLNDRSVGRVIVTNPDFPLKPAVEILYDNLGSRLGESRIVDLSKRPLLYITGSVDEKDIG
jgi:HD-GYP domain-containing protein (c-di-GMP phosphodiesterase class II)